MDKLNKDSSDEELFDDTIKLFCELSRYSYPNPIAYELTDTLQFTIEGIRNLGCNFKYTVNNNDNYIKFFANNESEDLINYILNIIIDVNNISRRRAIELLKEFFIKKLNKYKK